MKYEYIRFSNIDGKGPFTQISLAGAKDIPTVLEYVMSKSVAILDNPMDNPVLNNLVRKQAGVFAFSRNFLVTLIQLYAREMFWKHNIDLEYIALKQQLLRELSEKGFFIISGYSEEPLYICPDDKQYVLTYDDIDNGKMCLTARDNW